MSISHRDHIFISSLRRKGYNRALSVLFLSAVTTLGGISACTPSASSAPSEVPQSVSLATRTSLIPRHDLFADPTYSALKLSPDGTQVAYMKPLNGVRNIWVGPISDFEAAVPVTMFNSAPRSFSWSADGRYLLVIEDWIAREINQLWSVDLSTGHAKNLTDDVTVRTTLIKTSKTHPSKILVGMNKRDARFQDVFLVDLKTGEREVVFRNDGRFIEFRADTNFNVNVGVRGSDDGSSTYVRLGEKTQTELMTIPLEALRSTKVMSLSDTGIFTMLDSVDSEYANFVEYNAHTGERTVLAKALEADINAVFKDKASKSLWATREAPLGSKWTVRAPEAAQEFAALERRFGSSFSIAAQPDDKRLLILDTSSDAPSQYYWWNRETQTADLIFSTHPHLEKYTFADRKPIMIPTRDGLTMPSFLSLPPGTPVNADGYPTQVLPLVVNIHGGPWLRKRPGYESVDAWLADRGYAVISMNFRGSVGFGKSFTSAGDKQWAGDMHNDVIDSVDWAIENGITIRDKVASYGRSYGGYASMTSLSFTPDRFQCSVAIAGPSNLNRLMEDMPAWWRYQWPQWVHRVGNPHNPEDAIDLMNRSPISRVSDIKGDLLLVATGKDPRVLMRQSEQMVGAMMALEKPVTYLLYEEEGHGNYSPEVKISIRAVSEHFLADCLGNTAEPFGSDLEGSDIEVKTGAHLISALPEALNAAGTKRYSKPHIIGD